jgi:hypothetical protein
MEEDPMYLLGFDLLRVYRDHSLYMKVDFEKERVGFMIQERRELEEQLSCSFVSLRACVVGISSIRDS